MLFLLAYAGSASEIYVQLEEHAAISINKIVTNTTGSSNVSYSIKVKNAGEIELKNVGVVDTLQPGMRYEDSEYKNSDDEFLLRCLDIGENGETKSVTWKLGNLGTGQEKEIVLSVSKMNADADEWGYRIYAEGQALNNCVNDTMNGGASIFVDQHYDLENERPKEGEIFYREEGPTLVTEADYFIEVKNTGEIKLNEVWLNDTLPGKRMYLSSGLYDENTLNIIESLTPNDLATNDDNTTREIRWKLGDLEAGAEKRIKLIVRYKTTEGREDKYKENVVEVNGLVLGNLYKRNVSNEAKIKPKKQQKTN